MQKHAQCQEQRVGRRMGMGMDKHAFSKPSLIDPSFIQLTVL
jgi:hypothetical protein